MQGPESRGCGGWFLLHLSGKLSFSVLDKGRHMPSGFKDILLIRNTVKASVNPAHRGTTLPNKPRDPCCQGWAHSLKHNHKLLGIFAKRQWNAFVLNCSWVGSGGCNFEHRWLFGELSLRDLLVAASSGSGGKEFVSRCPCAAPCARDWTAHPKGTVAVRSVSARLMERSETGIWEFFQGVNGWGWATDQWVMNLLAGDGGHWGPLMQSFRYHKAKEMNVPSVLWA